MQPTTGRRTLKISMTPTSSAVTTRTLAPDAAAPERSDRPGRSEPRHEPRSDAAKGKRRDGDDSEAREPKFKGMGDHVPAFLLRSVERKQDA